MGLQHDQKVAFLKERIGKLVRIRGMWTGDFDGEVQMVSYFYVDVIFRRYCDKREAEEVGYAISLPIGTYMTVEEVRA